ncbi:aminotransferase-like domain-containing protein [Phreatobacter sp. AB_2022a]|uniref:aminotransferase-like domain-containing protein n=1 Tax=Phreatobacter sp. AB_2022a TaxID=3003134 RepID=UPI0022871772|nr:PLP-dependent aminotransferase family protein [Phreatobacter sp. AB_2022a]MCZ0738779.1 PLP-dependent aminotransferase family protein [Phreatobacter sp. AB_2022a]
MRLQSPWTPRLAVGGLAHEKLVAALAEDIAEGILPAGVRLPAHRELAYQLGLGLGTVTKAYAVLERRGLVQSVRGRGMFVATLAARPASLIDLSINVPPQMLSDRLLAAALGQIARQLGADAFGAYAPAAGRSEHRAAMARWLRGQGLDLPAEQVFICHGAQHALWVALGAACPPGGEILTEVVTYPGAIQIARQLGRSLLGLAIDAEGLSPAALEAALARPAGGARRVLYVTPTLHNPTTATMGAGRRQDIVRLCRAHDVTIVEDDVYAALGASGLPPLAALAPERTLHVAGLSKTLSPGLRIGSLGVPAAWAAPALAWLQASTTMASLIAGLIMEQWLADGTVASVAASIRTEARRRVVLAETLLPEGSLRAAGGFHVWLPMPLVAAERLARQAAAAGVLVMAPDAPLTDPLGGAGGIRLSLGGPPIEVLKQGLRTVAACLDGAGAAGRAV